MKKGWGGVGPAAEGAGLARGHGGAVAAAEPDPFYLCHGAAAAAPDALHSGPDRSLPLPARAGSNERAPLAGPAGARVGIEGEWPRPRLTVGPSPAPPFCARWRWLWLGRAPLLLLVNLLLLPAVPPSLTPRLLAPRLLVCRWRPPLPNRRFF